MAMTGGTTTREGIARLALSASDRMVRRRHVALAVSVLAHGLTLLAVVCLLQRIALPAPSPEPSIAMVFAPAAALLDATPAPAGVDATSAPVEPPIAEPPQPVEQAAPLPVEPEPKVEQAAPAVPPPVPVRPASRQTAAAPPSVHASRPAMASLSAPAAVAIAPLLPARPVAGMESDRPPAYPEMARRRGQQGRVVLHVNVSAEGMPVTVAVVATSGYASLDAAAMTAVQQWRFVPATRGGTPVPAVAEVPVRFRLTD
jgi:protein TonB